MVVVEGGDKRWISGLHEGRMLIVERTEPRHVYSGLRLSAVSKISVVMQGCIRC